MQRGDILGLQEMGPEEIRAILGQASAFKEILSRRIKKVPTLRGQSICTLFYEPSTRTRASFELAAKVMSADAINVASSSSSVVKGESLKDTVLTLEAMGIDLLVIRHPMAGAPAFPARIERLGVRVFTDVDEALTGADVVNVLRIQLERQERGLFPTLREYSERFGVNARRLERASPDVTVMHPGPMNRGLEIAADVADAGYAVITDQVTNGVAVRMALLYLLLGGSAVE